MKWVILSFIFTSVTNAQSYFEDTTDGNNLLQPELTNYSIANRSPGILSAPTEIIDADGNPEQL